jgi:hypothetical protein
MRLIELINQVYVIQDNQKLSDNICCEGEASEKDYEWDKVLKVWETIEITVTDRC